MTWFDSFSHDSSHDSFALSYHHCLKSKLRLLREPQTQSSDHS